eukprot:3103928-Rhodomonas_salina.4
MADTDLSAPVLPAGSQWKTGGYNVKPGENGMQDGDEVEEERMFVYKGHTDDRPLIWRQPLNDLVSTINELQSRRRKKLGGALSKAADMAEHPEEDYDPDVGDVLEKRGRKSRNLSKGGSRSGELFGVLWYADRKMVTVLASNLR